MKKTLCPPVMALVDLIRNNIKDGLQVCEIGCYDGSTYVGYIEDIIKCNGKSIVIDTFYGSKHASISQPTPGNHYYHVDNYSNVKSNLLHNIQLYNAQLCTTIYDMESNEAHKYIEDESLHICFVDGNHGFTQVKNDINNYLPKVKKGGILCGHDLENFSGVNNFDPKYLEEDGYNGIHCGVVQAVYDILGIVPLIYYHGKEECQSKQIPIWVYKKD